jgi:ABC-2 type transport system permease protein
MHLVAAELLKLRTTRLWWALTVSLVALTLLGGILTVVFSGDVPGFELSSEFAQRNLFGAGGNSRLFALVLGIIAMAGEYRQGTITPTFLAHPRRSEVVLAKGLAYGCAGLALGVVTSVVAAGVAYGGLALRGVDVVLPTGEILSLLGGSTGAAALFGVIGVGVGALVPNQIVAVVAALVEQLVVEPLLFNFFPEQGRFLMGGAASILSGVPGPGATLSLWVATVVLAGWCAALLLGGVAIAERKDVT